MIKFKDVFDFRNTDDNEAFFKETLDEEAKYIKE